MYHCPDYFNGYGNDFHNLASNGGGEYSAVPQESPTENRSARWACD